MTDNSECNVEIEDFKDFKQNEMWCENCSSVVGVSSEPQIGVFLCQSCTYGIEELYKEKHPEEYE